MLYLWTLRRYRTFVAVGIAVIGVGVSWRGVGRWALRAISLGADAGRPCASLSRFVHLCLSLEAWVCGSFWACYFLPSVLSSLSSQSVLGLVTWAGSAGTIAGGGRLSLGRAAVPEWRFFPFSSAFRLPTHDRTVARRRALFAMDRGHASGSQGRQPGSAGRLRRVEGLRLCPPDSKPKSNWQLIDGAERQGSGSQCEAAAVTVSHTRRSAETCCDQSQMATSRRAPPELILASLFSHHANPLILKAKLAAAANTSDNAHPLSRPIRRTL